MFTFLVGFAFGVFIRDLLLDQEGSVSRKILSRIISALTGE